MGAGAQPPFHDALRSLAVPFLALAGELDAKYANIARVMAALAPAGSAGLIPGAGHAAQLEAPDAVFTAVDTFLRQHYLPEAPP
ncbi:MAG: 2-succinyl-6-hydroxy-2,4-cyclohexadiene-1-carboxylate synthase, partial [Dehalococcoidia bacterium]|nr:2-succinyl-6-hydroxy-2,4-cyclohexadiene-1-carboxylate synthase [Dehalococcoidia bacterium]